MSKSQQQLHTNAENLFRSRAFIEVMKNLNEQTAGKQPILKKTLDDFTKQYLKNYKTAYQKLSDSLAPITNFKKAIKLLIAEIIAWRRAYAEMIKEHPTLHKQTFNIDEFLLGIQSKIKFDFDDFIRQTSFPNWKYSKQESSYTLQVNVARAKYGWTKDFVEEWRDKKRVIFQAEKNKPTQQQPKVKLQAKVQQSLQSIKQEKYIKREDEKPAKQLSKDKIKKEQPLKFQPIQINAIKNKQTTNSATAVKNQPLKSSKMNYQSKSQSDSDDSDQKESQDKKKSHIKIEASKTLKNQQEMIVRKPQTKIHVQKRNRVLFIKNYLANRKDLTISTPQNYQAISEFLNQSLQAFMKNVLTKIINAAKLRNYNYSKKNAGDQFRYFSKNNPSIKSYVPYNGPNSSQIYQLKYPSKLQIYAQLRVKEQEKQQKIRLQLNDKRETDKKKQNKILDFLLRPRQAQTQPWISRSEAETNRLVISNNHVQIVLEDHSWFNDGIAMLKSYHF